MLNTMENSRKIKWNLPFQWKVRSSACKAYCQKPSGAPRREGSGEAVSPLSPDGDTGNLPSCPRWHPHALRLGRRTYLASSRLPLACPGEPPAGRALQGKARQGRVRQGERHPSAAATARQRSRLGLPRIRDRPPRSPRLSAQARIPATGGRLGAAPACRRSLPGHSRGPLPVAPHPTQTLGAGSAVGRRTTRGAHAAPRVHPPGAHGRRWPSPGKRLAWCSAGLGRARKIPSAPATPSLPIALTLQKMKFSTPPCSWGSFYRR